MPMAQQAVSRLREAHCGERDIEVFFNSPPGQHAAIATGGDEHADPGARGVAGHTATGAVAGAGLGLVAGSLAGGPLGAAAGAAVGGYTGALAGTLRKLGTRSDHERWPSGVMVAVNLEGGAAQTEVLRILRAWGGDPVQCVEGEWREGGWRDFNPVSAPQSVNDASQDAPAANSGSHVVYRIFPGGYGKWNVFEGDMGKLLSEFPDRQEALDYATSLARTKANAVVEIYRAGGVLESSRAYSRAGANSHLTPG